MPGLQMLNQNFLSIMKKLSKFLFLFLIISCNADKTQEEEESKPTLFQDIAPEVSGIDFENKLTDTDSMNILDYLYYYNGGGVAVGDISNDGLPDIYFTGNQVENKLYLNRGNFQFEDITESAGVVGTAHWNTGVVMADVNGDGLLDIYTIAVNGIKGLQGKNELFINNGNNTFTEKAAEYGIDLENYGTTAAFFDFDNDGDLDLYVLNHAVHTQDSYGPSNIREKRHEKSGDKLFEYKDGKFIDISEAAGIYGGPNGYGLGLATGDFNNDGLTDIYVSNDFHEDDYFYINQGDGTFEESAKKKFSHLSRFSMGNDVADINHDGYLDIITLDMLAEDEVVYKRSEGDENINISKLKTNDYFGYHPQFSRNMLHINQGGEWFQEVALLSGIAATDWSWGALFGDYNLDGEQDLIISNGIPKRPNDLDYIKYLSNVDIQKRKTKTNIIDREALATMPEGNVSNVAFKGSKGLKFENVSTQWLPHNPTSSNGIAYADLDNDGDLDLIVNNVNVPPTILKNTTDASAGHLKIQFKLQSGNTKGIGAKVFSYHKGILQYKQLFTSRGFQSSSDAIIHLGYGNTKMVDSLIVVWPDATREILLDIEVNQSLVLSPSSARNDQNMQPLANSGAPLFSKTEIPGLSFVHKENGYIDFNRQKLIPYMVSNRTPSLQVGDLNNDGKEDIFIGSSSGQKASLFLQDLKGFTLANPNYLEETIPLEITDAFIEDLNNNGKNDLFMVTGGGEYYGRANAIQDRLFINDGDSLLKAVLPEYYSNASIIRPADFDLDGDLDVFIGGYTVGGDFGKTPVSVLLKNKDGKFSLVQQKGINQAGMITDAVWEDLDGNGYPELTVVGEWMSPKIFKNQDGVLSESTHEEVKGLTGLWQTVLPYDIDGDGDLDLILGNWGLNTKFKASKEDPLRMYYGDFDENGATETILAQRKNGKYYTLLGLDELASQLPYLRKHFNTYNDFAGRDVKEIFDKDKLDKAHLYEISTLESGFLQNNNGKFTFVPFGEKLQVAPITTAIKADFFRNGEEQVILGGNFFGVTPLQGGFGGFSGAMISEKGTVFDAQIYGLNLSHKAVTGMQVFDFGEEKFLCVTINNAALEVYKINKLNENF